jgi:hypothetical protein
MKIIFFIDENETNINNDILIKKLKISKIRKSKESKK